MRLIDADELIELLRHNKEINTTAGISTIVVVIDEVIDSVEKQPTAYDVDKVIEQLEEKILSLKDQLMYTHDEDMAVRLRCKMHGLDEAIDIVKAGMKE